MTYLEAIAEDTENAKKNNSKFFGVFYDDFKYDDCFYVQLFRDNETFNYVYFYNSMYGQVERNPMSENEFNEVLEKRSFDTKWHTIASGTYSDFLNKSRHQTNREIVECFKNMRAISKSCRES